MEPCPPGLLLEVTPAADTGLSPLCQGLPGRTFWCVVASTVELPGGNWVWFTVAVPLPTEPPGTQPPWFILY